MADRATGLPGVGEGADGRDHFVVHPQLVRIATPPGRTERVEIVGIHLVDRERRAVIFRGSPLSPLICRGRARRA